MKDKFRIKTIIVIIALLVSVIFYINQSIKIEYGIGIKDYLNFSMDFTPIEKEVLNKKGMLIYGGNINEPPLGIYYAESKQYIGMVVDYINALSIELETTILSEPMVWHEAINSLREGRTDLCDMIPSAERAEFFEFTNILYDLNGVIITSKDNKLKNDIFELNDLKVGVQKGDYVVEFLDDKGIKPNYYFTDNLAEALELMYNGEVQAVIGDEPVIWYHHNALINRDEYTIHERPLYSQGCVLAVPKDDVDLIPILNKAIFKLRQRGVLHQIERKWLGTDNNIKLMDRLKLNLSFLAIMSIIGFGLIYIWNRSLKLLVKEKTAEISIINDELQIAFDGMENFLVVINEKGKLLNVNTSLMTFLGLKKDNLIEQNYNDIEILHQIDKQLVEMSEVKSFLDLETTQKLEAFFNNRRYVAEIYPLNINCSIEKRILVLISDVTETRNQMEKMSHSNKMAAIGRLATGIAHELRNPLGVIRNSTFILDKELEKSSEHELYAINSINKAVKRASGIIDNLLNFSRMTYDQAENIDVLELIYEITRYYSKYAEQHNISIRINCSSVFKFNTNPEALRHILINLIQNGMDAMPKGGLLTILCEKKEGKLIVDIIDEGCGIEREHMESIFEPFFTTKPIGSGTGLGLYIVYSEIQKLGGNIFVETALERGTTFKIELPEYR